MKIPVSFKRKEQYIYDYVCSKFNYSAYIKELILKDMTKKDNNELKKEENIDGGFDF